MTYQIKTIFPKEETAENNKLTVVDLTLYANNHKQ